MTHHPNVDRNVLAGRIQGFGNVNPPPLEEETGARLATKAVGRLGDLLGEEVMLTVEDFKEKGAVGAVKDAVADAGDILIDGVSGIIGWIRGEPPLEDDHEKAEDATKALSNGPSGAAYGISQASPTGGINAVWVMPEDADPNALAQLSSQAGGLAAQQNDPRVPKNILPYQPSPSVQGETSATSHGSPLFIPGGPIIAPYEPAPSGPTSSSSTVPTPYVGGGALGAASGGAYGAPGARWGQGGYAQGGVSAGFGGGSNQSGARGLVERISKGEVIVGADVAKRLVSQCTATQITAKQLGDMINERVRRLYLGLDGDDDSDESLARLLDLADALSEMGTAFVKDVLKEIKQSVSEELLSLRSCAKHKDTAEAKLQRLGFLKGDIASEPAAEEADLLGGANPAEILGMEMESADLLGGDTSSPTPVTADADLLGGTSTEPTTMTLDPLLADASSSAAPASAEVKGSHELLREGGLLDGLVLDGADAAVPSAASPATGAPSPASPGVPTKAVSLDLDLGSATKKPTDAFEFVGEELSKAKAGSEK
eukprot:TRINITY_DN3772_c0_g1_i5.p1 TRINITY_DN3772_c0_g1~~TRINITY_DN3772_c0_g1_i5.p1  ORF type:complete len:543 (-),score=139.62 TRINITY_DN3772_c0_g1_i5:223-1851(-)